MKNARNTELAYRARYKQASKVAIEIVSILDIPEGGPPCFIDGATMMRLRAAVQDLDQYVHEMNAYLNVIRG